MAHQHSRSYTSSDAPPIDAPGKLTRSGGLIREASQRSVPKCKATTPQDWDTFDFEHGWLNEALTDAERDAGHHVSVRDWDVPSCRAIEAEYWRTLNLGMPPMYGADQQGTLFDDRTTQWNVGTLDSLLSRTLKCALPGVTTPYLYFGMWRASFAWHVEDMDLYSINYIHFGAPKQWYAIRQADRKRFESVMASTFPAEARKCAHFLRHKSFLVSPSVLASHGIQPLRLVQHAHEFVITYPYGYHSGYNLGFNCAESVNFALPTWIEIGRRADYCRCPLAQESVHFDVNAWWPTEQQSEPVALGHKCIFCPHDTSLDTLVPVPAEACAALERTNAKKSLSASASPYTAHRLCACFLPETWVDASSQVQGAATIERSRWTLKCQVCTDPADRLYGAKIQCTKGRCVHAVHVSCALNETSGWLLDICARETADQLEGVRSSSDAPEERAVVLCRAHNPHRRAIDMQRRHEAVRDKLRALAFPMPVRIKMQGAVWTVQLLGVDEAKHEVVVQESSTAAAQQEPCACLVLDEKPSPDTHRESKKRRVHCARDVDIYEN